MYVNRHTFGLISRGQYDINMYENKYVCRQMYTHVNT